MTTTKKLINEVETCVDENIEGFTYLNPGVRQLSGQPRVVIRSDIEDYKKQGKVTTLTGGGSGHEPCFMGFVGEGMMSAAVHGSLFASPSSTAVLAGIRAIGRNNPAGVIVVFNNYTGDRLNFGMAVERARTENIRVEVVLNAEDCAVTSKDKSAGRRGLAAMVFVMKVVGCLAERGESLEFIVQRAKEVTQQVGTMGVCLSPCSLPGGGPLFQLGPNDMELGMGMHGEAGVRRVPLSAARDVVKQMIDHMTDTKNPSHLQVKKGDHIALLINNMGSTSDLEINIVAREAILLLENQLGVSVDRAYASKYVASMEMAGFSITMMLLNNERAEFLDSAVKASSWVQPVMPRAVTLRTTPGPLDLPIGDLHLPTEKSLHSTGPQLSEGDAGLLKKVIVKACNDLIQNIDLLNELDSRVGDGDCGTTLANGAQAIMEVLNAKQLSCCRPHEVLLEIAQTVENSMGGSSGALYGLFLTSVAHELSAENEMSSDSLIRSLKRGIDTISRYGGAEPGDRTMLDPLYAAWQYLSTHTGKDETHKLWRSAIDAARVETERTAGMKARAGRASYVSADLLNQPDAGATGCVIWMSAALSVYYPPVSQ